MRPEARETELLRALASMPFLDRQEMAAVTGVPRGAVYEAVERLESAGLADSIPHASDLAPPTRRYCLTAEGLQRLAAEGKTTVDALLRSHPVSGWWRRMLLDRLDAIPSLYRLAAAVASIELPLGLRLYRAGPLDAAMTLTGERSIGIVRQGHAADRTTFSDRLWRLGQGPVPGAVLVIVSDEIRLRHARRTLIRTSVPAFLALERDAVLAGADALIWRPAKVSAALDLGYVLERLRPGDTPAPEAPPALAALPGKLSADAARALPVLLKPAEKRALDLLADWPWMLQRDIAGLMNLSEARVSHIVSPLEAFGLVTRVAAAEGRLALTDRGLGVLARRDRSSVGVARRRWSVAPVDHPEGPDEWRNITGGRSRQLLRNIEHTAAVHAFIAALAGQCEALGWELAQVDPPHRASRHFPHADTTRSVNPDAFGILRRGPVTWPFFLEWERRAVRPATMSQRLAPYLRYYSSHRPTDDNGVRPAVLVVFDDDSAATHFLRLAREETARTKTTLPLWVSHGAVIDALGPLGRAWRTPGDWEPAHLLRSLPRNG